MKCKENGSLDLYKQNTDVNTLVLIIRKVTNEENVAMSHLRKLLPLASNDPAYLD